jgi:4-amino-4-deoxy-L-arabinose transferase-like glycosyltransferase
VATRLAWRPVGLVLLGDAALLAATVNQYGYERDELYFRMLASHPAWGYVDQPPLTPMLAKVGIAAFGDNFWGIRVPAILCALAMVLVTALLARELGGGPAAQTLAAAGASSTFVFIAGHVLLTASPDFVVWLLVILFATRALLRAQPRWWLAVGLTVGLGLYNKQLIALLLIGLAVGLLIAGPRRELASPWLWAGMAIALLVGLPNLVYQITHHWPEMDMARAIARNKGPGDRVTFIPFQFILLGPPLAPIWLAGLIRLFRDPAWRAIRAVAWAYPVVCVLVLVSGGQGYYTFGLVAFLYAAGSVVTAGWAAGHTGRWAWSVAAVAVTVLVSAFIALPLIPVKSLPSAIPAANQTVQDSIGWPTYVRQVAGVYRALPESDRVHTVLYAGNYGEAGSLDRYGPAYGLPAVYSAQNELYNLGPPPDSATVVVEVNEGEDLGPYFDSCTRAGTLDNGVGVDNEEQGAAITVCRGPHQSWRTIWPHLRRYS